MIFIIIILIFALLVYKLYTLECIIHDIQQNKEHMQSTTATNPESVCNLASLYNNGTLTVSNLVVTGNASVTGNTTVGGTLGVTGATTLGNTLGVVGVTTLGSTLGVTGAVTAPSAMIGNWNIRNNQIGCIGVSDISMDSDGWTRLIKYGTTPWTSGVSPSYNKFATSQIWCGGDISANNITAYGIKSSAPNGLCGVWTNSGSHAGMKAVDYNLNQGCSW